MVTNGFSIDYILTYLLGMREISKASADELLWTLLMRMICKHPCVVDKNGM